MSHNVVLKGVKITDLNTLKTALDNLGVASKGVTLDRDAKTFRTYPGQSNVCDAMIKMPGRYDIGLRYDKESQSYSMVADFSMMHDTALQHEFSTGHNPEVKVSALVQEYGLLTAEYQAAMLGRTTQRVRGDKGMVALEIYAN